MDNRMKNWEYIVSSTSSTSDIISANPSGDYSSHFVEDAIIKQYKMPRIHKENAKKKK